MTDRALRSTPLRDEHLALDAKMVPFAGYEMPVQYPSGIQAEHRAVRESAGLFDVSHMGEIEVTGPDALAFIQRVTVNDASTVDLWQAQYSAMCTEAGGVIDDLLVYRFPDHWVLVVNASNRARDWAWLTEHAAEFDVQLVDRSDEVALLALQGPAAREILSSVAESDLDGIEYYRFSDGRVAGVQATISATGYTGEDGFELYVAAADAVQVWRALLDAGGERLIAAGLGARDSLRLEMGYALHGNDLDEDHSPLESALGWIVKLGKGPFIGSDFLAAQKEAGPSQRLVGLRLEGRAFPRPGYPVVRDGEVVGALTSGTSSPSLGVGVGLGRVAAAHAKSGTELGIEIRGKLHPAVVARPPFYTEGSIRR